MPTLRSYRTALHPELEVEVHTSQNRYALLGREARLGDHYYRQVYIGCYAENAQRLVGYLVSDGEQRPTHVASEQLPQPMPPCLTELGRPLPPLIPRHLPPLAQMLGYLDDGDDGDAKLFLWFWAAMCSLMFCAAVGSSSSSTTGNHAPRLALLSWSSACGKSMPWLRCTAKTAISRWRS